MDENDEYSGVPGAFRPFDFQDALFGPRVLQQVPCESAFFDPPRPTTSKTGIAPVWAFPGCFIVVYLGQFTLRTSFFATSPLRECFFSTPFPSISLYFLVFSSHFLAFSSYFPLSTSYFLVFSSYFLVFPRIFLGILPLAAPPGEGDRKCSYFAF